MNWELVVKVVSELTTLGLELGKGDWLGQLVEETKMYVVKEAGRASMTLVGDPMKWKGLMRNGS